MPNSPESSGSPLHFIAPHVIDRLIKGSFVAKRKPNKAYQIQNERRSLISPLNVTRRAIKYEPLVFENRSEQVLASVKALNDPIKKVVLVAGAPGTGKTSFLRAVAEMMGGGQEQLIWFDVSRHTDVDELVRYLVDSMVYVLSAPDKANTPAKEIASSTTTVAPGDGLDLSQTESSIDTKSNDTNSSSGSHHPLNAMPDPTTLSPIDHLDTLLKQWPEVPFVIAIDNVEHLVGADHMLKSRELKDALNFLLGFPNIKLIMAGSQLPHNDLSPTAKYASSVVLRPLSVAQSQVALCDSVQDELLTLWKQQLKEFPEPLPAHVHWPMNYWPIAELAMLCNGEPWLIKLLGFAVNQFPNPAFWQEFVQEVALQPDHDTAGYLFAFFQTHLTERDAQVMDLLAMLRHGMTLGGINTLLSLWSSAWGLDSQRFTPQEFQQSWLFPLLKKQYPPQMVLNQLRQRFSQSTQPQLTSDREPIEAYYELNEHWVTLALETFHEPEREALMATLHDYLAGFYMDEKVKPLHERVYPARIRHLVAEAQYHAARFKRLHRSPISQNQAIALAASTAMPVQSYAVPETSPELLPKTTAKPVDTDILSSSLSDMVKRHYPLPFPAHDDEKALQSELFSAHHDYDDAPVDVPPPTPSTIP